MRLALLHDAAEAYLCDVPAPLKRHDIFAGYRKIEDAVTSVIRDAFGLNIDRDEARIIKRADIAMLEAERVALMPACDWWDATAEPVMHVVPWSSADARDAFLEEAGRLAIQDGLTAQQSP